MLECGSMEHEFSESKDKRIEHMARRRSHGLKIRELAEEFNTSKSTAHRKIKPYQQRDVEDDE